MPVDATDFGYVRDLIRDHASIVLDDGKEYLVETRLEPLARREGFADLGSMVDVLRTRPVERLHRRVIECMTTNETSFFRDIHPFDALKRTVLPDLIAARAGARSLDIWCAGCASGQEPYSILMLLRDSFPSLAEWNIRLLATDLSPAMIERARAGTYTQLEVNRGLPATMLVKFFEKDGDDWHINERARRGAEFRELNLAAPWPAVPRMDIVFLRNVMIYLDLATKRRILAQLRDLLRPDGLLFLGAAETTYGIDDAFECVTIGKATAYRVKPAGC